MYARSVWDLYVVHAINEIEQARYTLNIFIIVYYTHAVRAYVYVSDYGITVHEVYLRVARERTRVFLLHKNNEATNQRIINIRVIFACTRMKYVFKRYFIRRRNSRPIINYRPPCTYRLVVLHNSIRAVLHWN